jgi:hypothetical protein
MTPRLDLTEEFAYFRREMEEVLAAIEIGDLETIGHIRRTHISISFACMMRYAGKAGGERSADPRAEHLPNYTPSPSDSQR